MLTDRVVFLSVSHSDNVSSHAEKFFLKVQSCNGASRSISVTKFFVELKTSRTQDWLPDEARSYAVSIEGSRGLTGSRGNGWQN